MAPTKGKGTALSVVGGDPALWVRCPQHPATSYRRGGFCEDCWAEETQGRVRALDGSFASQIAAVEQKVQEILSIPVEGVEASELKAVLGPIVRLIEIVSSRFKRPEKMLIQGKVAHVHLVGAPTDFRKKEEG